MLTFQEKREYLLTVLFRSKSLSSSEKLVALALAFKIDYTGITRITQAELGAMSSMNKKSARRNLYRLKEKIGLEIIKSGRSNEYRFIQWNQI